MGGRCKTYSIFFVAQPDPLRTGGARQGLKFQAVQAPPRITISAGPLSFHVVPNLVGRVHPGNLSLLRIYVNVPVTL